MLSHTGLTRMVRHTVPGGRRSCERWGRRQLGWLGRKERTIKSESEHGARKVRSVERHATRRDPANDLPRHARAWWLPVLIAYGRWHTFIHTPPSHPCHGLPALRMPVCLRVPPVRTPDPPHPARLPTQPPLCARPSRNRNLSARISNNFFFSASKNLGPTPPAFSADSCARTTPHGGVYGGPHKCV